MESYGPPSRTACANRRRAARKKPTTANRQTEEREAAAFRQRVRYFKRTHDGREPSEEEMEQLRRGPSRPYHRRKQST